MRFLFSRLALAGAGALLALSSAGLLWLDSRLASGRPACESCCRLLYACDDQRLLEQVTQLLLSGAPGDLSVANQMLRDLLERDPASAYRWIDLGGALAALEQPRPAEYCFLRAYDLSPHAAEVLLGIGEFYFNRRRYNLALPYFGSLIKEVPDPVYHDKAFSYFSAMQLPFGEVMSNARLETDRATARSYFRYLLALGDAAELRGAWAWLKSRAFSDLPLAGAYADALAALGLLEQAAEAWRSEAAAAQPGYGRAEFLFNGDFETLPAGGFFDWRLPAAAHVTAARDPQVAASGSYSLRIAFDGTANLNYSGPSIRAWTPPGRWRFQARVRSEGLTTDQGLVLHIADFLDPGRLSLETDPVLGTTGWRAVGLTFLLPPPARVLEIRLLRRPSRKIDNKIAGVAWIDAVSLQKAG